MDPTREVAELNMVDARRELTRLPERLSATPTTVTVTRRGKPVLAIMSWEDYEAIVETLEVLSDEDSVEQLRRSIQDVKQDQTLSWDAAKAQL